MSIFSPVAAFVVAMSALTAMAVLIAFGCRWIASVTSGGRPRPTPPADEVVGVGTGSAPVATSARR
jgi:hypothetical protein